MKKSSDIPFVYNGELRYISSKNVEICLVIPTYNESENIIDLLDEIYQVEGSEENKSFSISVLVVDDNSPDGTADRVKSYPNDKVHLLLRYGKSGLGSAYIDGMQYALNNIDPDIIFEMDADFSHDPREILKMAETILEGADVVIGSRYIDGGTIPEDWGLHRKLMSGIANNFTKTILNIREIKDITGGYRAIRSSSLKKIDFSRLDIKGYVFQIALLSELMRNGAVVKEIPIQFQDRTNGESKVGLGDITELGFTVLKMGAQKMLGEI